MGHPIVGEPDEAKWWRNACVYQVYLRSFKDADGDGNGDINGLRQELGHIASLGCDAIWLNPIFRSPQRDHGYDIADYRDIDPMYGTLEDFDTLLKDAHSRGLKILMDIVPNHCSDRHCWFQEAIRAEPGSPARHRFHFAPGRGARGEGTPNNWQSVFGGPAWSRVRGSADGEWYLHAFDSSQPDFNWRNEEVREEFDSILKWWFDRGVDGFRIDVAHGLVKADPIPRGEVSNSGSAEGLWNQPEIHEIYRRWRAIANGYAPKRYLIGEVWVSDPCSFRNYTAEDELHQAFAFDFLVQPWIAARLRSAIDKGIGLASEAEGPAWTLANHDVHRAVTRYGQEQVDEEPVPDDMLASARKTGPVDVALGTKRAGAALALMAALPGTIYVYQGEELGLTEHLELAPCERQDPIWYRTGGTQIGRDGCRIPMPWKRGAHSLGFSEQAWSDPWLPQPKTYEGMTRDEEALNPHSMFALYRRFLQARNERRRSIPHLEWLPLEQTDALAFDNGAFVCVTNTGATAIPFGRIGGLGAVIARSDHSERDLIEGDSTVWFERLPTEG